MKLSQVIPQFLDEADIQSVSKEKYRIRILAFFKWVQANQLEIENLSKADIIRYKTHLNSLELSQFTKRDRFAAVGIFYRWASSRNIHNDITVGIKPMKCDSSGFFRHPLSTHQVRKLLSSIDRRTEVGSRDYAIISTLVETGLRREELLNIDIGDISIIAGRNQIRIKGKGRQAKDQMISITDEALESINDYLSMRYNTDDQDPLFTSSFGITKGKRLSVTTLSHAINEYLKSIGLSGRMYSCHSLRHTTACLLLETGHSLLEVQTQLRHKSLATTQRYTKVVAEQERLQNRSGLAIRKLISDP